MTMYLWNFKKDLSLLPEFFFYSFWKKNLISLKPSFKFVSFSTKIAYEKGFLFSSFMQSSHVTQITKYF